jgi:uncharacterized protein (UPF0332 family)
MDGSEFQDTAERLAQGNTEGDWRSAMSRAYYAVFHYFRSLFLSHGLDLGRGGQAHFNLYVGLMNSGFPAITPIGGKVDDLRDNRVRADYDLNSTVSQQDAASSVQAARSILTDFQALLSTIPVNQIVDGVRNYLRSIGHLRTP